ncbi:MAG: hypothetical protein Q8L14_43075 [Myxococcales bacterium]|nr:hypothetical protein [Myxococcales bacterium]
MNGLRLSLIGFGFGVLVAFAPSCGGGTCNATNCSTGCCDSMNRCQPGTTATVCGKAGAACGACAPGQACTLQICGGPMGTGGGSGGTGGGFAAAGGAAGGSTVMDAGCMDFGDIDVMEDVFGSFNVGEPDGGLEGFEWWYSSIGLEAPMNRVDFFDTELYFETVDGPPTFPYAGNLPANTNYTRCIECFVAYLGCDDNGENCDGEYLATAGSYSFTAGTRREDAGVFIGGGTNLVFRKWNLETDRPNGSACFTVGDLKFRGVWPDAPVDAGVVDAGARDAGTRDGG